MRLYGLDDRGAHETVILCILPSGLSSGFVLS